MKSLAFTSTLRHVLCYVVGIIFVLVIVFDAWPLLSFNHSGGCGLYQFFYSNFTFRFNRSFVFFLHNLLSAAIFSCILPSTLVLVF